MRKPCYPEGCVAGSQVLGDTWSADHVFVVNFNNGNVNNNHRNNKAFVRPVCAVPSSGECQGTQDGRDAVSFRSLYDALQRARRNKRPSCNQLDFEARWADGLIDLANRISAGTWSPAPATCFIAKRPKAREIHAPDFSDRVVHHWVAPKLEAIYEPTFIHDSYGNRKGKGTHAAVQCLQQFVRQVHSGQGRGWYLQLDIHNFFNSIHRPTLYRMVKPRLLKAGLSECTLRVVHALLRHPLSRQGVIHRSNAADRAHVPPHKRLENAPPGCGIAIGNLSSQWLANIYLDPMDQFIKHVLRAKRYLRYVDDFILVHHDRAVLEGWLEQIRTFLGSDLRLGLKDDIRLRPLTAGIDFLGYGVYPTHTRVRRRVISHARESLTAWSSIHLGTDGARATPEAYRMLEAVWASYQGHFRHADAWRLTQSFYDRMPWLNSLTGKHRRFSHRLEGKTIHIRTVKGQAL